MLEKFRVMSQTWVAKVILALITIPFALFGVEYYFRQAGGGADTVAKVDGYAITQTEFTDNLRNQLERMQAGLRDPRLDPALLDTPELRREALAALVNRRLLTGYADRVRLTVPDTLLVNEISQVEAFQEDGKFSRARYEEILRSKGLTPALFESRLRDDLKIQLVQESLAATQWLPQVAVDAFLTLNDQSRELSVAEIPLGAFLGQVKIDESTVKQYYDAHLDRFNVPERVKVQYLVLTADQLAQDVVVTPQEIAKAYADPANQARWGGGETRRASHILITVPPRATDAQRNAAREQAQKVLAEAQAHPDQFAALAKKYSQDPGSSPQGGDLGYFGHGVMAQSFEAAVFGMKSGEVRGPVETEFGFHIIKLTDIKAGKVRSLAEVTPQLTQELRKQHAAQRFAEVAENFSNLVYEQSTSLKPAADKLKLTIKDSGWITRGGAAEAPLLNNPKLLNALFSTESTQDGRNTQAIEVAPNTLVAAHVVAYEPSVARPFAEVKGAIGEMLQREEAAKLVRQEGEARLADLKAGKTVVLTWSAIRQLTRRSALSGGLPSAVVTPAFQVSTTHLPAYTGAVLPTGSYILVRVTQVTPGNPTDATKRKQAETGLTRAYGDATMSSFMAGLRKTADVRLVNKAVLDSNKNN
ncbi:MAG: peptidylprolyl isomerase [Ferrovum sp.]|nr:peptidylprolyl isomerase [Ferrovum sp.]